MNALSALKPYLPLALRVASTIVAALTPIVAAHGQIDFATLGLAAGAGSAAWKRWHESASLSSLSAPAPTEAAAPTDPAPTETP